MKLPNWFRIVWWVILIGSLSGLLKQRLPELIGGKATAFDGLAFVILICLSLAPIFSEVTLPGITLKQQIESVKAHVDRQVETLRAEINNSVEIRSHFNPNITFSVPPPDTRLPEIEAQVQRAIEKATAVFGLRMSDAPPPFADVPPENIEMFSVRYNIERELNRIWVEKFGIPDDRPDRPIPPHEVLRRLAEAELISPDLGRAVREVYSVCSTAIHGLKVSQAKLSFVREVATGLLVTLRAI